MVYMKKINAALQKIQKKTVATEYHRVKTLKTKTYKTQQTVSLVNKIISGKVFQIFPSTFLNFYSMLLLKYFTIPTLHNVCVFPICWR